MSKRAKSDTLTGGSKDVNPQWLNMLITQTAPDAITTIQFPLPVQRLAQEKKKSLVLEILKVASDLPTLNPTAGVFFDFRLYLSTKNPNLPAVFTNALELQLRSSGTTIWYNSKQTAVDAAGTSTTYGPTNEPLFDDLTDGAGHGILVATDNLFLTLSTVIVGSSNSTGVAASATLKILYRWKEVTLEEYIGIVQSQQQ